MNENLTTPEAERPNLAKRVLSWLRQGYPNGVPKHDTFALFYVLERRLVEEDRKQLVEMLITEDESRTLSPEPITREAIAELIQKVHSQPPVEEDIARIEEMLNQAGFPTSD